MESMLLDVVVGMVLALVGYLLKRKDEEQEKLIEDLYNKHNTDAERLHQVELKLAADHYVKSELDTKFDKLELVISTGFRDLNAHLEVLCANTVARITYEESRRGQ